jgi:hypothetical protein
MDDFFGEDQAAPTSGSGDFGGGDFNGACASFTPAHALYTGLFFLEGTHARQR